MTETSFTVRDKLKARVCQLVLTEGQLDMATWAGFAGGGEKPAYAPECGTACCCAGNVVIAARELGLIEDWEWRGTPVRANADYVWAHFMDGKPNFFRMESSAEQVAIHVHTGLPYGIIELLTSDEVDCAVRAVDKFIKDVLGT